MSDKPDPTAEEDLLDSIERSARRTRRILDDLFPELDKHNVNSPIQQRFLNAYILCGRISEAARKSKINYTTHHYWMHNDEAYQEAFQRARDMAGDIVEDEAMRRAVDGWEEPVFYQGQQVGVIVRYDGVLLAKLLAGFKPGVYHTKVDITTAGKALGVFFSEEAKDAI